MSNGEIWVVFNEEGRPIDVGCSNDDAWINYCLTRDSYDQQFDSMRKRKESQGWTCKRVQVVEEKEGGGLSQDSQNGFHAGLEYARDEIDRHLKDFRKKEEE